MASRALWCVISLCGNSHGSGTIGGVSISNRFQRVVETVLLEGALLRLGSFAASQRSQYLYFRPKWFPTIPLSRSHEWSFRVTLPSNHPFNAQTQLDHCAEDLSNIRFLQAVDFSTPNTNLTLRMRPRWNSEYTEAIKDAKGAKRGIRTLSAMRTFTAFSNRRGPTVAET